MAHGEVKHDYHLVNPSPWPFTASVGAFVMAIGAVVLMRGLSANEADFFFGKGHWTLFLIGTAIVALTCIGWWGDVIKESRQGDHTPVVDIGLRYGMILFIASEVMFFVAWFWMFFELAIFHEHRAAWIVPTWDEATTAAWANWPRAPWPPSTLPEKTVIVPSSAKWNRADRGAGGPPRNPPRRRPSPRRCPNAGVATAVSITPAPSTCTKLRRSSAKLKWIDSSNSS